MKREYMVNACSGRAIDVLHGQTVTIVDIEGGQVVDFFAEIPERTDEFLSAGVTIDCNGSLKLKNWRLYFLQSLSSHIQSSV